MKLEIDDERTFDEKMRAYSEELSQLLREEEVLTGKIKEVLDSLGYRLR